MGSSVWTKPVEISTPITQIDCSWTRPVLCVMWFKINLHFPTTLACCCAVSFQGNSKICLKPNGSIFGMRHVDQVTPCAIPSCPTSSHLRMHMKGAHEGAHMGGHKGGAFFWHLSRSPMSFPVISHPTHGVCAPCDMALAVAVHVASCSFGDNLFVDELSRPPRPLLFQPGNASEQTDQTTHSFL